MISLRAGFLTHEAGMSLYLIDVVRTCPTVDKRQPLLLCSMKPLISTRCLKIILKRKQFVNVFYLLEAFMYQLLAASLLTPLGLEMKFREKKWLFRVSKAAKKDNHPNMGLSAPKARLLLPYHTLRLKDRFALGVFQAVHPMKTDSRTANTKYDAKASPWISRSSCRARVVAQR